MVDKLWYDWQNKHPENRYAFLGGSVSDFGESTFDTFRSGAPPFLNVSSPLYVGHECRHRPFVILVCLTAAQRRLVVEKFDHLGRDGD